MIRDQAIEHVCGNCRFQQNDEHGGGWNQCLALDNPDESERYKYSHDHACDTLDEQGQVAFKLDYYHLDLALAALRVNANLTRSASQATAASASALPAQ